jgi:protein TonB
MESSVLLGQHDAPIQDRLIGAVVSALIHAAGLVVGAALLTAPPEYGLAPGEGSVEVHLVAALPGGLAGQTSGPSPVEARQEEAVTPELNEQPQETVPPSEPRAAEAQTPSASAVTSDGSSPVPGTDATTLRASGGGWAAARPGRIRNPAPRYPELARQLAQEGVVLLLVDIDSKGHPTSVTISQSSGFALLDASALDTVRRWRFSPARAGGLPVASKAQVPIEFRLDDRTSPND